MLEIERRNGKLAARSTPALQRWRAVAVVIALAAGACSTPGSAVLPLVASTEWGGTAAGMPLPAPQVIQQLTVHHQGELWQPGADVPAYLRRLQRWSREAKGWADVPYHYIVAPDGTVYAGRSPALPGDTNTEYEPRGHLQVMLLGNFEVQSPTPAQWSGTVRLLAQLLVEHRLPPEAIGAHRHHSAQTVCPGAHLFARFDELRSAAAVQARAGR